MKQLGRPVGSTGPRPERIAVKTWKPRHDRIVMAHLAGYTNIEIARMMSQGRKGFTPERVGQILLDPRAQALIARGRKNIIERVTEDIDTQMVLLAQGSLKNLKKTVDAKIPVAHPAKRHQDQVGLKLLSMIGYGTQDKDKGKEQQVSPEILDRLTRALERSANVTKLHSGEKVVDAEIIEENPKKVANA